MSQLWQGILRYKVVVLALVGVGALAVIVPMVRSGGDGDDGGDDKPTSTASAVSVDAPAPVRKPGDTQPVPENCDEETNRIEFPSVYAPPCVYEVDDNGGATSKGVTADSIKVIRYIPRLDPSVQALLRANGAADLGANVEEQYDAWFEMFQETYETYGRTVQVETFEATAPASDDTAARADAISVAAKEPFLVMGGPEAFIDELANREIICITQSQAPIEFFENHKPYVYGTQMSSTQAFLHLAEYIGKRLDGKAVHAGSDALKSQDRKFGIVYAETPSGLYGPGIDAFARELGKYDVELAERISYTQEVATAQEQARTIVARLKDSGITSVLFAGDAFAPIFLTNEASSQEYFPEWVVGGGNLVDTTALARRYNEQQWEHAFGVSQLWIRPPRDETEVYHQHEWFHDRPPFAGATFEILYQEPLLVFTGLHMAGPDLTVENFRDGLFAYPPSGGGLVTQLQRSWGSHEAFPFTDWTGFDTTTEVWWDKDEFGRDETGAEGYGHYMYVDGGKRYTLGEWPESPANVFKKEGSLPQYDELPESDRYPEYDSPG